MNTKRVLYSLVILALVVGLLPGYSSALAQSGGNFEITRDTLFVPGEVVVGFTQGLSRAQYTAQATALAGGVGAQVVDRYANMVLLSFAEDADVISLADQIGSVQGVAYAEPNYISWIPEQNPLGQAHEVTEVTFKVSDSTSEVHTQDTISVEELKAMRTIKKVGRRLAAVPTYPDDPSVYDAWGWWYINTDIIWPEPKLSPVVCVLDTGIDYRHPDLLGAALNGRDFVNEDLVSEDDNGHGTHVAGTVAARMNNKKGIAGVSNGRVLGVKVLSAQGWGTSFDIASGVVYCADRLDVKIINMSLGGYYPSLSEFYALEYAINFKAKLVVAAAGNDSTSDFYFPAAWSDGIVCINGSHTYPKGCSSNTIFGGLISVGAIRSPRSYDDNDDDLLWIDTDGDEIEPSQSDPDFWDEHAWVEECATDFSNYGAWVEIVAPGEDILSTVPTSYMYWNSYFWDADPDGDGYDWWSGTSTATPYVAGTAARLWSLDASRPFYTIKDMLVHSGWFVISMMDPNMIDPADGYQDKGYSGEAPFCWPDETYGGLYSMSNVKYLDVSAVMNRAAIRVGISDALSGVPLTGAYVYAYNGFYLRGQARVVSMSRWVMLINLPAWNFYDIKVAKGGYTSGQVWICKIHVPEPTFIYSEGACRLAIPPIGHITAVLNWEYSNVDLDLFTWLPLPSTIGGVVGSGNSGHLLDIGPGTLTDFPRAHWNREGGNIYGGDWLETESITIKPMPGAPTRPYYNLTSSDYYDFLVTDYGTGDLNDYVILRLWAGGKIIGVSEKWEWCDVGHEWWWAGWLNYGTYTDYGICSNIWPYVQGGRGTAGIPEHPFGK